MNLVAMFVLGLFLGWLAEWALDWYYWRGQIRQAASEVPRSAKNIPITDADGNDNFQAIKGIGPVFAKRLKEAGIVTFEQLSRMKSRQMEEVLGTLYKRFFSKEETILAQAREFARQRAQNK
jgi:predicted flap endonuclease-1-like 5' DNA nuclease